MKKLPMQLLLAGLLSTGLTAQAAENPTTAFNGGLQAFRAGDYAKALNRFEAARAAGMDTAQLYFNLGVVNFQLKRYAAAHDAFVRAAQSPQMRALSHYNLGLVAQATGDTSGAATWFRRTRDEATDAKLRAQAERQLGIRKSAATPKKWFAVVALNAGYDTNLINPTNQAGSTASKPFLETTAFATGVLSGTYRDGVRLNLAAYANRYKDFTNYDITLFSGELIRALPLGAWDSEGGIKLEQSTLGGHDYLRVATATVAGQYDLSQADRLRLRYRYSNLHALNRLYDPLQGSRHRFDVRLGHRLNDKTRLWAEYRLELNNRNDLSAAGTFTSYSPTRHMLRLAGQTRLGEKWRLGGEVRYRHSKYNDPNLLTGGQRVTRTDNQTVEALRVGYQIRPALRLNAQLTHTHNASNINIYDYNQNLYSVGLSAQF